MKVPGHRHALFLMAQVISIAVAGRAIGDAGWKATGMHTGLPLVVSPPGVHVRGLNAEHTIWELDPATAVRSGDRVAMIPHYTDSTILLHRRLFAARGGVVEAVWPISAAGMLQ
jgi:D-serine deaminase-like pyridoxal phosphate-dependent protein